MKDNLIKNMKRQMIPSDDVISDLLRKISTLEASSSEKESSPSTFSDFNSETVIKKIKIPKTFWLYSTATAAAVIFLVSTFSLFQGEQQQSTKLLKDIFDNPAVVFDLNSDDETTTYDREKGKKHPKDQVDSDDKNSRAPLSSSKENVSQEKPLNGIDQSPDETKGNGSVSENGTNGGNSLSDTKEPSAPSEADPSHDISESEEKDWNSEILAEPTVSSLVISGNNYVVPKVSAVATTSEVAELSLKIKTTSNTKPTKVAAKVKKIKNVSSDLIVAVDVEGFSDTLIYTNDDYKVNSLGKLVSDTGLKSYAKYGKRVIVKGEKIGYSSYKQISVPNLEHLVTKYIFSNQAAPLTISDAYGKGDSFAIFRSTNNPTGYTMDFGVSDNGYVHIKISNGKAFTFKINEKDAKDFITATANEKES